MVDDAASDGSLIEDRPAVVSDGRTVETDAAGQRIRAEEALDWYLVIWP